MNKISVGETIFQSYGFAARRILRNLGLSWLAAVFYAVAAGYWLQQFCTTMLVSPHPGSELNDFALFDLFCLVVVTALGNAVIARILTGAALEPGGEMMTAYLAVAKREWLLFLSLLRLYVLIVAAVAAVVFSGGVAITVALPMIGAHAQWQGISALTAMEAGVAVICFVVTAVLAVRLGFFAAPVASAEHSASATRVWSLCHGNSWRVFAVVLALSVPTVLLWAVAEWALIGNDLAGALTVALSASHSSNAFYQLVDGNASAIAAVWTVLLVVLNMLFAGASAPAYLTVRDNVVARTPRSVERAPVLEPAFAGSFADFAPRHAKEPSAGDIRIAPSMESFAALETHSAPEMVMHEEAPVAEGHMIEEPHQQITGPSSTVGHDDVSAASTPVESSHEAAEFAAPDEDGVQELSTESVEAASVEPHVEEGAFTPLPSHDDGLESSQQNAPSEVA